MATKHKALEQSLLRNSHVKHGILPVVAIFGANAAGKTSLHYALENFSNAVNYSHRRWKADADLPLFEPHFFSDNGQIMIEAEFIVGELPYRFGFVFDRRSFLKEWLFQGNKRIYEREGDEFKFGRAFKGPKSITKFARPNSLFLSTATQNNHEFLAVIANWISQWMALSDESSTERFFTGTILKRKEARQFVINALKTIDSQIVDVDQSEKVTKVLPFQVTDSSFEQLLGQAEEWDLIRITRKSDDGLKQSQIRIGQESAGTRRYLSLIGPLAMALSNGLVVLIDEADSSLHPTLLKAILQLFHSPRTNPKGAQLIFNTHDTTLLSGGVMRPDEVSFMEKDGSEGSVLYSLADFIGIRSELSAQRQYLEGRFGALPFLEDHLEVFASEIAREGTQEQ